ncbi:MAG: hypothetical protein IJS67_00980 [Clostridia bacterium]|nr:hypothetical protein [Clostridia bacterium]
MKNFFVKIVTLITAAAVTVGALSGCGLFPVDTDRDMDQVIATVKIDDGIDADDIYKRELVSGYLSYGYSYVQNYSYTTSKAYSLVLDNLISNSVIIQKSRLELAGEYADLLPTSDDNASLYADEDIKGYLYLLASEKELKEFNANYDGDIGSLDYVAKLNAKVEELYPASKKADANSAAFRFVKPVYVYEAIATAVESVSSIIESMSDAEEESTEYENYSYDVRTTPSVEEDEEKSDDEKIAEYKKTISEFKFTGTMYSDLVKGYNRLVELGLLDSNEKIASARELKSVLNLSYFRNAVASSLDNAMVNLYEKGLRKKNNLNYTDYDADSEEAESIADRLWEQYLSLKEAQSAEYKGNIEGLETQLGNAGENTFVVYNTNIGYVYVSHLVVQFDEEQKTLVSEYQSEKNATADWVDSQVKALAKKIVVKDLRDSWVQSGYGKYDGETGKFTFGSKYVLGDNELADYMGTIGSVKTYDYTDDDGNEKTGLRFFDVAATDIDYNDFRALAGRVMNAGGDLSLEDGAKYITGYDGSSSRIAKADFNNFEDLKFAFSTDTGNFNKYLGYVYSPVTSASTYVKAFTAACVDVAEKGVGAYKMFASAEYGLHIVLCTAKADFGIYNDIAAFKADLADKDSVAYLFMQANVDLVTDDYISNIARSIIYNNTTDDAYSSGKIQKYERAYNDLITE